MSRGAIGDVITTLRSGAAPALLSAALFGASTPLAKLLLRGIDPWMLAGILYLGSGLGLISLRIVSRALGGIRGAEARVQGRGWLWLGSAILSGGVVGPAQYPTPASRKARRRHSFAINRTAMSSWSIARKGGGGGSPVIALGSSK